MTGKLKPGIPFPVWPLPPELVVADAGNYEQSDGCRVVLSGDSVVFQAAFSGVEAEMIMNINDLLDAIGRYNKQVES